ANQRFGQQSRADLRAVDKRKALLGLQMVWLQVHTPQGSAAAKWLWFFAAGIGIAARRSHKGVPLADQHQRQMRQRSQIAAGAHTTLFGNRGYHAAVVKRD